MTPLDGETLNQTDSSFFLTVNGSAVPPVPPVHFALTRISRLGVPKSLIDSVPPSALSVPPYDASIVADTMPDLTTMSPPPAIAAMFVAKPVPGFTTVSAAARAAAPKTAFRIIAFAKSMSSCPLLPDLDGERLLGRQLDLAGTR